MTKHIGLKTMNQGMALACAGQSGEEASDKGLKC